MILNIVRSTLPLMPTAPAFALTRLLASIPPRPPLKERDRDALAQARPLQFGRGKRAWSWGSGPLVVFVHGWGGRGVQLAPLARHVAAQGFEAVVFDVTAHGASSGWRAGFADFVADLGALVQRLDKPVHAYVGHSAGGLAMMAARALKGFRAPHYICLCAPRGPYVPIDMIRRLLGVPEPVLQRCRRYYAGQFAASWEELDRGRVFAEAPQGRLLLVYDEDDDQVQHTDGDRIRSLWPAAQLLKTRGLGHHKVLWDRGVMQEVAGFLQAA